MVYLNEQKVMSLSEAAIFADEFALTHKTVFVSTQGAKSAVFRSSKMVNRQKIPNRHQQGLKRNVHVSTAIR